MPSPFAPGVPRELHRERELLAVQAHLDGGALGVAVAQQRFGERILDLLQDGPAEGARAQGGLVAQIDQAQLGLFGELEGDAAIGQELVQAAQLDVDDLAQVDLGQRAEDHHVVDAVQELGAEELAQLSDQHVAQGLAAVCGFEQLGIGLEDALRADVAGHDHHRVREAL